MERREVNLNENGVYNLKRAESLILIYQELNVHRKDGQQQVRKKSVLNSITNIIFIDDNTIATTNALSYEIRFWDLMIHSLKHLILQKYGWVKGIFFSPKSNLLAVLLQNCMMLIYSKKHNIIEFSLRFTYKFDSECQIFPYWIETQRKFDETSHTNTPQQIFKNSQNPKNSSVTNTPDFDISQSSTLSNSQNLSQPKSQMSSPLFHSSAKCDSYSETYLDNLEYIQRSIKNKQTKAMPFRHSSSNDCTILYACQTGELGKLNLRTNKLVMARTIQAEIFSISKWNNQIILGTKTEIIFCSILNFHHEASIKNAHSKIIHDLQILDNQTNQEVLLFSTSFDRTCKLWNIITKELLKQLDFSADHVRQLSSSTLLINSFHDNNSFNQLMLLDTETNEHFILPFYTSKFITSINFSSSHNQMIIGFQGNQFEVYTPQTRKHLNKQRKQSLLHLI